MQPTEWKKILVIHVELVSNFCNSVRKRQKTQKKIGKRLE